MVFKKLKDNDRIAYLASQSSYKSKKHRGLLEKDGYKLDNELSVDKAHVYSDNKGNVVIAFRGTRITDKGDLISDNSILFNKYQDDIEFKRAEVLYEKTKDKYKDSNILLTGHSLGGTKAIHISKRYNNKNNIVFNPGTGVAIMDTPGIKVYNTDNDIISGRVDKSDVLVKNKTNPHSLSNYEDLFS